ncbi:sensor histidine kinase [Actinocorallia populi]|uniref:sensor histidine kinase n=1 Tax=Actinocorallia populi TaxID=2079200 RepID=UPI000D0933C5|nr:sensor histidine kinase [Actinocorallia populi]
MSGAAGFATVRSHDRAARIAGGAAAGVVGVLVLWLAVLLRVDGPWTDTLSSRPRWFAETTRIAVGVPICVLGVMLLADRFAHRLGGVVLAAGGLWLVPAAVPEVFSAVGGGTVAAGTAVVLRAVGIAGRSLSVLLFPLVLAGGFSRPWRRGVAAVATVWYGAYAVVWAVGTPGAAPFPSPWGNSGLSDRARVLLDVADAWEPWVWGGVTVAVTAGLSAAAYAAGSPRERYGRGLLAVVYPLVVYLLMTRSWSEDEVVMAARLTGVVLWAAVICVTVVRAGLWRLDRVTGHRLAVGFVATGMTAALLGATVLFRAFAPQETLVPVVAGCALVTGWLARPFLRWTTLRVERVLYGPRARPREAVHALATRLRQAPGPAEVPEQICRTVVEDLGLSGAAISVDTMAGPRLLATAGAPLTGWEQQFPLHHHGLLVGRLTVARDAASTPADRDGDLLALLADQAAPALAALRLAEQAQAARERLVLAREEERRRLRREIHDGLGPQLAAVQLRIGIAQDHRSLPAAADRQLQTAADQLGEALTEVRRITAGLAPTALVDRGLTGAVNDLAHRLNTPHTAITVGVPARPLPALSPGVETAAYRIVSEALTNAVRHAQAANVRVTIEASAAELAVTISDDGSGFSEDLVPGTGLGSLTERAEEIGGSCEISSDSDGVRVRAVLPITI